MRTCFVNQALRAATIASVMVSGASVLSAQTPRALPDSVVFAINKLYESMARPGSPGCAAGVYQNGEVVFAGGYGYADLINNIPITASTRFTVGSVSKQFTAASIALLVQAGRLSLNDDVRKYIPELQTYPTPVTIATLVHHTSGVRDFWELVDLAGMRPDDGYTSDDMLNLAEHQKGLNFPPGSEYRYSNTGYLLLGIVVKRVTGQSLRRFADSAIFKPLGMTSTLFLDDHNEIVPRRASAYQPDYRGGYKIDVWNNDIVGQGGVVTTIGDLQKWDENFYTARVGGPEFIKLIQSTVPLTTGKSNNYAFGLEIGDYRGAHLVSHTGSTGGYRAAIFRFPDSHTTVAMLCNVTTANTTALSRGMADAVLGNAFTQRAATAQATMRNDVLASPPRATFTAAVTGRYRSDELLGAVWEITAGDARSIVINRPRNEPATYAWNGDNAFAARGVELVFENPTKGKSPGFTVKGSRVQGLHFERIP
jgi:CubicO group peptidase (beta-lactamase class C family)